METKRVVIVGGGFAGLSVAKGLSNKKGVSVQLIDRRNHHLFQPLLYQVAMAGLSPAEIAAPIRGLLSDAANVDVIMSRVTDVDLKNNEVISYADKHPYDFLVLACGAKHSYFGHKEWEQFAPGLKTLEQATEIRRRVLIAFERAERETDRLQQRHHLTFVIVGGGPTGVELAGAVGEISRFSLSKDFRRIDPNHARVILIEAGPRILSTFSSGLSRYATRSLEKLGVQVWTSSLVSEITEEGVQIGREFVNAGTVLWAAGVQASGLNKQLETTLYRDGRVIVKDDLSLPDHPNTFVLGDQAAFLTDGQTPLPGLAPVAIQQGRHTTRNILADIKGKPRTSFRYADKGQMATIGRSSAILQFGKMQVRGFPAWLVWLFIHIYYLIGFKNRLFVLLQWFWHYLSYKRGARLIVHKEWRFHPKTDSPERKIDAVDSAPD